jgi:PhnB protein
MQLCTYLFFTGNCEEAFKFYEKLLGGKIEMMMPHDGSPAEAHVPPEWGKKILHARMVIGESVLMASDAPPANAPKQMEGFSVSLTLKDPVEGERIFRALEEKGKVQMPFQQTFWALRFGMVTDRFGVPWMINCEQPA